MKKFVVISTLFVAMLVLMAGASGMVVYMWAAKDLPGFKRIADYKPALVTTVYARNGEVLGYLYKEKRFLVRLDDMPRHLPLAFLAAEDKTFFRHEGIDLSAIVRAFVVNLRSRETRQGGSTITQQIIKRLLLTSEKSYERKLKEALLAYRLERYLTKDEILTIYLNEIYLGARAYGVEAAARVYFGKHVQDLTLAESAMLAGLPQAPSRYNPYRFPERAKARQKYVLDRLREENWISQEEYDQAQAEPLEYKNMTDVSWQQGAYYLEEVRRWLVDYLSMDNMNSMGMTLDRYGEEAAYTAGLHVYTAVDLEHQKAAEEALRWGLEESSKRRGWLGPVRQLQTGEFENFLEQNDYLPEDLHAGAWVLALVTKVEKKGAQVRVGSRAGFIGVESMAWARTLNPAVAPEHAAKVTDATKLLKSGDVVWASVQAPDGTKNGEPKAVDPKAPLHLALEQRPKVQGALVSLEPQTGDVRALVGGYSFQQSQFNRATQARRQPGSAFKPVVYSAALDHGFTPASIVIDAPLVIEIGNKVWRPQNFTQKFHGPTTLRVALAKSYNLVTIRIAQRTGIRNVIKRAKDLGLKSEFPPYLPISLGAVAVTPINLCEAYTTFARGGTRVEPRMVLTVKGPWGDSFYQSKVEPKEAISPQNAYVMNYLMQQVVQMGTATRAKKLGRPVAGKTGTTNEERDAWFMGYTPYLLTGVYVGFDQLQPMGKFETGSRAALPIWLKYREAVEENYPVTPFPEPMNVVNVRVNSDSGQLASPGCDDCVPMPFIAGTEPIRFADFGWGVDTGPQSMEGGAPGNGAYPAPGQVQRQGQSQGEDLLKQIY